MRHLRSAMRRAVTWLVILVGCLVLWFLTIILIGVAWSTSLLVAITLCGNSPLPLAIYGLLILVNGCVLLLVMALGDSVGAILTGELPLGGWRSTDELHAEGRERDQDVP